METPAEASSVEILAKADAVLSALEKLREATVQALAHEVDEPVSSTYRLLNSLSALGMVSRGTRRGLYRIGFFPLRIGGMVEERLDVRELAAPTLHDLGHDTAATVFLCVRRGVSAVCVERIPGPDVRSLAMRLGDALPLWRGGAGKALLANLPDSETADIIAKLGEDSPAPTGLTEDLRVIRERGYSVSDGDVTTGIAAIGAPVFNHRGELECAVSVSGLRGRILPADGSVAAAVVRSAAVISASLGYEAAT